MVVVMGKNEEERKNWIKPISRKEEGWAKYCFCLKRTSLPSPALICTTYRPKIIDGEAEQFIVMENVAPEKDQLSTLRQH